MPDHDSLWLQTVPARSVDALPAISDATILTDLDREHISAIGARIREREMARREGDLQNGVDLLAVKRRLPHGQFLSWVKAEFEGSLGWSLKTIERMMGVAETFHLEGIDRLSNLKIPKTAAYALAAKSTPASVRQQFVAKVDAGESFNTKDVLEAKRVAKEADARLAMPLEEQNRLEKRERAKAARDKRLRRDVDERMAAQEAAHAEALAVIRDRLGPELHTLLHLLERAGSVYLTADCVRAMMVGRDDPDSQTTDDLDPEIADDAEMEPFEASGETEAVFESGDNKIGPPEMFGVPSKYRDAAIGLGQYKKLIRISTKH